MTKAKSPWQPIETAPEHPCEFLVDGPRLERPLVAWVLRDDTARIMTITQNGYQLYRDGSPCVYGATHWMPIPPPPDSAHTSANDDIDMDLLEKLDNDGGRRTGALRRAGYLEWTITENGRKALEEYKKRTALPEGER